ncbi:predicted protein [Phaeodactylum tricornutum CCAP 1055/1]|uniref:Uncharacterized protein n=1 Tax=Phaeodactylum tricornutum (strain CCAP 1055/1) TaxID=556484 RepID=B7S4K8_PHATC|nr:predicted protein [Phaeodactylum tricornutum CCAP 1055/1]EEC42516.1 predicted protein [Phaeodactylum tricornutum CCAP 1055/1]|eukprot:XP_002176498.1 predicted protein [Phaeodactylum tricornutum CCAP 1055/1]
MYACKRIGRSIPSLCFYWMDGVVYTAPAGCAWEELYFSACASPDGIGNVSLPPATVLGAGGGWVPLEGRIRGDAVGVEEANGVVELDGVFFSACFFSNACSFRDWSRRASSPWWLGSQHPFV